MLNEAILAIADDMDKDAEEQDESVKGWQRILRSYAKQLRTAVRASDGAMKSLAMDPFIQHRQGIDAARAQLRAERATQAPPVDLLKEDAEAGHSVWFGDGPMMDTVVNLRALPGGKETVQIEKQWYKLKEGKLWLV